MGTQWRQGIKIRVTPMTIYTNFHTDNYYVNWNIVTQWIADVVAMTTATADSVISTLKDTGDASVTVAQ